jgi:hypothetical protein
VDLSSAYLQIELHEESRKYTAFLLDSNVYQFSGALYGFKNSLLAFVRALKLPLGESTIKNVLFYDDDFLVHPKTFEEHLRHLEPFSISSLKQVLLSMSLSVASTERKSNSWDTI